MNNIDGYRRLWVIYLDDDHILAFTNEEKAKEFYSLQCRSKEYDHTGAKNFIENLNVIEFKEVFDYKSHLHKNNPYVVTKNAKNKTHK